MPKTKGSTMRNTMRSLLSFRVKEDYIEADGKMFFLFRIHPRNMTILSKEEKREEAKRFQHMLDALDMKFSVFAVDKTENLDEIKRYYESLVASRPDYAFINGEILNQLTSIEQTSACVQRAFYMIIKVKDHQEVDNFVSQMQGCFIFTQAKREEIIVVLRNHILREFTSFRLYVFIDQIREKIDAIRKKGRKIKRPTAVSAPIQPLPDIPVKPVGERIIKPEIPAQPTVEPQSINQAERAEVIPADEKKQQPDVDEEMYGDFSTPTTLNEFVDMINPPRKGLDVIEPQTIEQADSGAKELTVQPTEPDPVQNDNQVIDHSDIHAPVPTVDNTLINPPELCPVETAEQDAVPEKVMIKRKEEIKPHAETSVSTAYQPAEQSKKKAGAVAGRGLWPFT